LDQYDFNLKRTVPWRDVIENQVTTAKLYELSGLYNINELDIWRRQLFDWLQEPQNEPLINNHYLLESNVGTFIDNTFIVIYKWMKTKLGALH
jgi:hypothetical protein